MSPENPGRRRLLLIGGGIFAVLIITTLILGIFVNSQPGRDNIPFREYRKVADNFVHSLGDPDSAKSYRYLSRRLQSEEGGFEAWNRYKTSNFSRVSQNFLPGPAEDVASQDNNKPKSIRFLYYVPTRRRTDLTIAIYVTHIDGSLKVDQYIDKGL